MCEQPPPLSKSLLCANACDDNYAKAATERIWCACASRRCCGPPRHRPGHLCVHVVSVCVCVCVAHINRACICVHTAPCACVPCSNAGATTRAKTGARTFLQTHRPCARLRPRSLILTSRRDRSGWPGYERAGCQETRTRLMRLMLKFQRSSDLIMCVDYIFSASTARTTTRDTRFCFANFRGAAYLGLTLRLGRT